MNSVWLMLTLGLRISTAEAQQPIVLEGHENVVSAALFSDDGERLISASWDKSLRVWDMKSARSTATLSGHRDWVLAIALSPDGERIVSASQREIRVWDANTFELLTEYPGLGGAAVNSVAFSEDARQLATGGRDGTVKLWQVGDANPSKIFKGFDCWVHCVAFSADNKTLAAGTRTGRIRLFDLTDGADKAAIEGHDGRQVLSLAASPKFNLLASAGYDQTIKIWDLASGREQAQLTGHKGIVTAVAWSPDGKLLASGDRHGPIKLWDMANGNRLITTLPGHSDDRLGFSVTALAFSPDGRWLASGSYDKTLKLWTLPLE